MWLGEDEGQLALLIDGVVQSVLVDSGPLGPGYWPQMLPEVRPGQALILGMGGGTIAHLLMRRFGPVPITGVELDRRVIRLGHSAFGLEQPNIRIVAADAFAFAASDTGPYDYIAVDLFDGGRIPAQVFGRPFLKHVRRLLAPGGLAAFNFFRGRRSPAHVRRLESVFPRVAVVQSADNLIARCRAR